MVTLDDQQTLDEYQLDDVVVEATALVVTIPRSYFGSLPAPTFKAELTVVGQGDGSVDLWDRPDVAYWHDAVTDEWFPPERFAEPSAPPAA